MADGYGFCPSYPIDDMTFANEQAQEDFATIYALEVEGKLEWLQPGPAPEWYADWLQWLSEEDGNQ